MLCPECQSEVDTLRSAVKNGEYISERCDKCLAGLTSGSRHFLREWDKREHAKSLIQPWEKSFPKEYGYDKAREAGWTDEQIRKLT